jgi:3-dehydroquinate synthase
VSHGQAVAIGIALDAHYAQQKGWLSTDEFRAIYDGLTRAGFVLWNDVLERHEELLCGLKDFQEHLGGELCVTMPIGIGRKFEVNEIDSGLVVKSIAHLKHAHSEEARTAPDVLPQRSPRRTVG